MGEGMDLPDVTPANTGGLVALIGGSIYTLRKLLLSDRVTSANDNAQINMIANLQAERDAAVKRADEAVAARDTAMQAMNELKIQIVQLQSQVQALTDQVTAMRAEHPVVPSA